MQTIDVPELLAFGPFLLDPATRSLCADGEKLPLSSRAFDILSLLIAEHARVVSKEEIIASVWRGLAVEENNLAVQISALRRVLADHAEGQTYILTVPGQGYRFVGRIEPTRALSLAQVAIAAPGESSPQLPLAPPPSVLPAALPTSRRGLAARIALLAMLGAGAALTWHYTRPAAAPRLSIAVLPFRNLSEDRSQDFLADAISDDLTTDLAHLPGSVVIARESSDVYKGHAVPAEQIGRALHVRYLLEGSLRAVESTFSVNAQLIDARDGSHLWATQFSVPRDKLRDAQTIIVGYIGSALHVKLVEIESDRARRDHPRNPDAEDLYLQGRFLHDRAASLEDLAAAQALLTRAASRSPHSVPVKVELVHILLDKVSRYDDPDDTADFAEARRLSESVLEAAPQDDGVLTAAARLDVVDGKLPEGLARYRDAIAINPNNVRAHVGLFGCENGLGHFAAALAELQVVLRLDPQGPNNRQYFSYMGSLNFYLGQFQPAVEWLQRSLAAGAEGKHESLAVDEWSTLFLMAALDRLGRQEEAQALFASYRARYPNRSVWRISTYLARPVAGSSGFDSLRAALIHLGFPLFAHASPEAPPDPADTGDFAPPPREIPGSSAIDLSMFHAMEQAPVPPLALDVGRGAAMLPGMIRVAEPRAAAGGIADALARRTLAQPVVIIGSGWSGWDGVEATRLVVESGASPVYWLRGGEEAIAAESAVRGKTNAH